MKELMSFIAVFWILVFIHEFGHFIVAKWSGVTVHEFSLGMGPSVLKYQGKETLYALRLLPIGGYVKMEGDDEISDSPNAFNAKSPVKRFAILFAGPFMNFVLAFVIISGLFTYYGLPVNKVGGFVQDNSSAQNAGLEIGDEIVKIDDKSIDSWNDVTTAITLAEDDTLEVAVIRDNKKVKLLVDAQFNDAAQRRLIGIYPKSENNIISAIKEGISSIIMVIQLMVGFLVSLFMGKGDLSQVSGAVGIYKAVGEASNQGALVILDLTAMLSINLGIVNLLPFPALDGGRILFVLIELVRGRPIDQEKEGIVHLVGFAVLMVLMILLVFKDLHWIG